MIKIYETEYAGHTIFFRFTYPETKRYFRGILRKSDSVKYDIYSTPQRIEKARRLLPPDSKDGYIEYRSLISLVSKHLLKYHCCIFHCVSFVYQGYAWLLSGPSGIGKTTQYLNWIKMFPDEITMISGDMPVLELKKDQRIWVHPTSWNGKENIGNRIVAPLGGIICLKQDCINYIEKYSVDEGLMPIYSQMIVLPDTKEEITAITDIMNCIFRSYPVWQFPNKGDNESTILLRNTISKKIGETER